MSTKENEERIRKLYQIVEEKAPRLPYHNIEHIKEVTEACNRYGEMEGLNEHERYILETAALTHDIIYIQGRKDNEERSAELTERILEDIGYSQDERKEVARLILATKMPTKPKDLLEKIICDSDLDNLGSDHFFRKAEQLREEEGIDRKRWYEEIEPAFLSQVKYYTESAEKTRAKKVREQLEKIRGGKW